MLQIHALIIPLIAPPHIIDATTALLEAAIIIHLAAHLIQTVAQDITAAAHIHAYPKIRVRQTLIALLYIMIGATTALLEAAF